MMKILSFSSRQGFKISCILIFVLCSILLLVSYFRADLIGYETVRIILEPSESLPAHQPSANSPQAFPSSKPCQPLSSNELVGAITVSLEPLSWNDLVDKYAGTTSSVSHHSPVQPLVNPVTSTAHNATNSEPASIFSLGLWTPLECRPVQTVAIVLPFRARDQHLRIFLNHMHGLFRHQRLRYTIFVIEQIGTTHFNRAALFNIGFLESTRVAQFDCFIFHDVDLLPQDDRIPYQCGDQPIHLSVAVDKFGYRLLYEQLFGGVVAFNRKQFVRVHGFSNVYFGWGGEDDDMFKRLTHAGYSIFRHPNLYSRYTMIKHSEEKLNEANPHRHALLQEASKRFTSDGYTKTLYNVVSAGPRHGGLVYWIQVDLHEEKLRKAYHLKQ